MGKFAGFWKAIDPIKHYADTNDHTWLLNYTQNQNIFLIDASAIMYAACGPTHLAATSFITPEANFASNHIIFIMNCTYL
jgi:hypothetical protein